VIKGFKDFVMRGNLIEVAVGLVMALAVFALVQALIADLITPIIAAMTVVASNVRRGICWAPERI